MVNVWGAPNIWSQSPPPVGSGARPIQARFIQARLIQARILQAESGDIPPPVESNFIITDTGDFIVTSTGDFEVHTNG